MLTGQRLVSNWFELTHAPILIDSEGGEIYLRGGEIYLRGGDNYLRGGDNYLRGGDNFAINFTYLLYFSCFSFLSTHHPKLVISC